jgi:tankyrase
MTNDSASIAASAQVSQLSVRGASRDITTNSTSSSNTSTSLNFDRHDDDFCISINDENSLAYEACKNGDMSQVKQFINASNVNIKDKHGRKSTFLHFAAGFGRKEVCDYLLSSCKADPSIKDEG